MTSRALLLPFGLIAITVLIACGTDETDLVDASSTVSASSASQQKQGVWELVGVFDSGLDVNVALGERKFYPLFYDHAVAVLNCEAEGDPVFSLFHSDGSQRPIGWTRDEESGQYTVELPISGTELYTVTSLHVSLGDSSAEWDLQYKLTDFDWPEEVVESQNFNMTGIRFTLDAGQENIDGAPPGMVAHYENLVKESMLPEDEFEYEVTVEWPGLFGKSTSNSYDMRTHQGTAPLGLPSTAGPYPLVSVVSAMKYRGEMVAMDIPISGEDSMFVEKRVEEIKEPKRVITALGREVLIYGVHIGSGGTRGIQTDIRIKADGLSLLTGEDVKIGDFTFKAGSVNFGEMVRYSVHDDGSITLAFEFHDGSKLPEPLNIDLDFREVVEYERVTALVKGVVLEGTKDFSPIVETP